MPFLNDQVSSPHVSAQDVLDGTFFARAVYGDQYIGAAYRGADDDDLGMDDRYRAYLNEEGWTLLDSDPLGTNADLFTEDGLFGRDTDAQALVAINDAGTLMLALRGSDSGFDTFFLGQAFTASGQYDHYVLFARIPQVTDPSDAISV